MAFTDHNQSALCEFAGVHTDLPPKVASVAIGISKAARERLPRTERGSVA